MCLLTIGILWKILRSRDGRHVEIGVSDIESIALDRVEDVGRVDHGPTIHLDVVATIDVKESGTLVGAIGSEVVPSLLTVSIDDSSSSEGETRNTLQVKDSSLAFPVG